MKQRKEVTSIAKILKDRPYNEPTPMDRFSEKVRSFLPDELHDRFRPLHLKDGTLTVACLNPNVAYVLRKHEQDLLSDEVNAIRTMLSTWR